MAHQVSFPPHFMMLSALTLTLTSGTTFAAEITLVSFGKGEKTNYHWTDLNDPVMGGKSTSS